MSNALPPIGLMPYTMTGRHFAGQGELLMGLDYSEEHVAGESLTELGWQCDEIFSYYDLTRFRVMGPFLYRLDDDEWGGSLLVVRRGSEWSKENGFEE